LSILKDMPVHGLAHITGGGLADNILRIVPKACNILIQTGIWDIPPVFHFLQQAGKIPDAEMQRTFNNGIGMIAIVPPDATADVLQRLEGMNEKAFLVGEILECKDSSERIIWE
jgi:phosphoribosylformylglycinamidine cyclo-ligase